MLAEVSVGVRATATGVKVAKSLHGVFQSRRAGSQEVRAAKRLLGIDDRDQFAYRAAGLHPLFDRGRPHPDDRAALAAVAGDQFWRGTKQLDVITVDDLAVSLSHGMVLVGSPEAEGVARLAFGYRQRPDGQGMRHESPPIDLPFRWEEDLTKVTARCERMVDGRGLVTRPNWPIVDQRPSAARMIYPRVRNNGLLDTDLLLITKVPNYLTRDGIQHGRSLVTFAGTHGTGTRAIEILLRDRSALREIAKGLGPHPGAFQVLAEAGDLTHGSTRSKAKRISLLAVERIDRDDQAWDTARRIVERDYGGWIDDVTDTKDISR